jgi:hypothetical protein
LSIACRRYWPSDARAAAKGAGELGTEALFDASYADIDRLTFSPRLHYVYPTNDQAFSAYFADTLRFSYLTPSRIEPGATKLQSLVHKSFHLDRSFQLVPGAADTSAETVWSFGLTAFAQKRFRQPQLCSDAVVPVPSASWVNSGARRPTSRARISRSGRPSPASGSTDGKQARR